MLVADEVATQARRVASDARQQVRRIAEQQQTAAVKGLRQVADELDEMSHGRSESPARTMVAGLAERGRRMADILESRGPDGVLAEVQDFARRRPGTFLLAACGAGFVIGRLGRNVLTAPNGPLSSGSEEPRRWPDGPVPAAPQPTTYASTAAREAAPYPDAEPQYPASRRPQ